MLRLAVCLVAGLFFLAAGGYAARVAWAWHGDTRAFVARSATAEGEVVGEEITMSRSGSSAQRRPTHWPVFLFRDAAGAEHRVRSRSGGSAPLYETGQRVPVRYDTADPARAEIDSWNNLWLGPLLLGAGGAVAILVGGFILYGMLTGGRRVGRG